MGEWYSLSADIYDAVLVDGISSIEKLVQMNILLDFEEGIETADYKGYTLQDHSLEFFGEIRI